MTNILAVALHEFQPWLHCNDTVADFDSVLRPSPCLTCARHSVLAEASQGMNLECFPYNCPSLLSV